MSTDQIKSIQTILGVESDGAWGPISQAALDAAIHPDRASSPNVHAVRATSFADPADVHAFRKCKAQGNSDEDCFRVGDNGIGCWGDDCTGSTPMCALPPEDMEEKWGSVSAAKHKQVVVTGNGRTVTAILGDRMPHRKNIRNGAGIDMNPALCAALELNPPVDARVTWAWA